MEDGIDRMNVISAIDWIIGDAEEILKDTPGGPEEWQNRDVRIVEAKVTLRRAVGNIRLFTDRYGLITVITDISWEGRRDLGGIIRDVCDWHVRLTPTKNDISLFDVDAGVIMEYWTVSKNQMMLRDYRDLLQSSFQTISSAVTAPVDQISALWWTLKRQS